MVCVKLPESVLADFHLLLSNEVAIFFGVKRVLSGLINLEHVSSWSSLSIARVGQGSLLSGMSVFDSA